MNPWNILGWILVAFISIWVVIIVIALLSNLKALLFWRLVYHSKTRNTPVEEGQIWSQKTIGWGEGTLEITHVGDDHISMRCGNTSWSDSREQWKSRVKSRRMYLVRHPKH